MNPSEIQAALSDVRGTTDALAKSLKLAGLVSSLFKEKGWEMVVVGGSAIEVYTEGQYMSGDIDMCGRIGAPPPRVRSEVMASIGATGGPRNFRLNDRWIDLLGPVERMSAAPFQQIKTPYGPVTLMPVEELLVDRIFTSVYPQENDEAKACAEKLMAVCIGGDVPVNWDEAAKMADSKAYGIGKEFDQFRKMVSQHFDQTNPLKHERPKGHIDVGGMDCGPSGPSGGI